MTSPAPRDASERRRRTSACPLPRLCAVALGLLLLVPPTLSAQPVAVGTERVELGLVLRQLGSVGTFLMATAHPDDENNALLAMLARGEGHRTVLVTATRGDGGQNEIGAELFDALAILRTEELLAAHRLDGAEQYFTRAVDFGYSFSQDETFARWGRDEILADYVRMIRTVRPHVITAMSPDGQFGGQHHQASAILAHEAYHAAADAARFPEQLQSGLRPWQADKFYFSTGFGFRRRGQAPPADATTVDLAVFDPLLGRTYAEIGSHARGMHKCQGMSPLLALPGPARSTYRLTETTLSSHDAAGETDLFAGVATDLTSLTRHVDGEAPAALTEGLATLAATATTAQAAFASGEIDQVRVTVRDGLLAVRELRRRLPSLGLAEPAAWEIEFRLAAKERQWERALVLSHGVWLEALATDGVVVPGQPVTVATVVANRGRTPVDVQRVTLAGFGATATSCPVSSLEPSDVTTCETTTRVPDDAAPTSIHWTHVPGAARYALDPTVEFGVPFRPTPFVATIGLEVAGVTVAVDRPIRHRSGQDIFAGEKRSPLNVVPRLALSLDPEVAVVPRGDGAARLVRVTVANAWPGATEADVSLDLPPGWQARPASVPVRFAREDEQRTVRFELSVPADATGEHTVTAYATNGSSRYDQGYQVVEYPHIGRRHLVSRSAAAFRVIDVSVPEGIRVGYVDGVGDAVPAAIAQLGVSLEFLDEDALAWGDLDRFDVIVTGVRAYERRLDLRAHNDRLLAYVEAGGTLIVQYNKFEFNDAQYGPYPAVVSRNRVTDEAAPVRMLETDHPVFGVPNLIGAETWDGWVQERGLYFLGDRDPAYADLVELEDTFPWNPGVKRGALVEARPGEGRWIYVGLGLWRQLPAGTPGAYRLLANLLSLGG